MTITRFIAVIALVVGGCVGVGGTVQQEGRGNEVQQGVVAVRAEMQSVIDARDAEIVGLKATVEARDVEIVGLKATVGDVSAVKSEAGGDVNSTTALIVAIVATPVGIIGYMVANRFGPLRKVKNWVKGCR